MNNEYEPELSAAKELGRMIANQIIEAVNNHYSVPWFATPLNDEEQFQLDYWQDLERRIFDD